MPAKNSQPPVSDQQQPVSCQVRVLQLEDGQVNSNVLYRLTKGTVLQFVLGPSLLAKHVRVFSNHPETKDQQFNRTQYRSLPWKTKDAGTGGDDTGRYAYLTCVQAGSFNYYVTYLGCKQDLAGSGYFLVDPCLRCGPGEEPLPLDAIQMETMLSKLLGPFDQWLPRMEVAAKAGYNVLHLTPVQSLGGSNSSYCVRDQLQLNSAFKTTKGHQPTYSDVAQLANKLDKDYGMLCIQDVVLNHTSTCSPWLKDHPESGYNMVNSPHLRPAYLFDRVIWYFSLGISKGMWEWRNVPQAITTESHLMAARAALLDVTLPKVNLHQFYLMNIDRLVDEFRERIKNTPAYTGPHPGTHLKIIQDPEYRRFHSTIDMDVTIEAKRTTRKTSWKKKSLKFCITHMRTLCT